MPCALSDCGACGGIAHVVHQSWMTAQLPGALEPLSARWQRAGPSGWEHRLWTDEANRALWAAHFPDLLSLYDGYSTAVQRADVTRLLYMHVHGGVYADLDVAHHVGSKPRCGLGVSAAQLADWPRLAGARGSLEVHALALKEASDRGLRRASWSKPLRGCLSSA